MQVHILHVGKAGGNSIRWAITSTKTWSTPHGKVVVRDHFTRLADVPDGDCAVIFVRDPVTRFISGFEARKRRGRPKNNNPWTRGERRAFLRFRSAAALAEALADGRPAARRAMGEIGHLRAPLSRWLGTVEDLRTHRCRLLFVGRIECFDADLAALGVLLGAGAPLVPPADPVAANRNPRTDRRPLSSRGTEAIRSWYADDYALLDELFPGFYRPINPER